MLNNNKVYIVRCNLSYTILYLITDFFFI